MTNKSDVPFGPKAEGGATRIMVKRENRRRTDERS